MKPRGGALKIAAVVAGVLLLCLVAAWFMWAASADRRLDARLAELEAAGYATDLTRLAPPLPPDDDNAATLFDQAFAGFPNPLPDALGPLLDRTTGEFSDEERATMDAFFLEHAEAFALLDEAASLPRCVFPRDYSRGYAILLPQIANVIKACKLLRMRVWRQAADGDVSAAARTIETTIATAECCGDEPILVSQLVRIVGLGIAIDELQSMMLEPGLPPEALRRIRDRLDPDGLIAGMRLAYRGELAFASSMVRAVRGGDDVAQNLGVELPAVLDTTVARPLIADDLGNLLDTERRMIEAADRPYPQAAPALAAIDAEVQATVDWRRPISGMMMYAVGPSHANAVKMQSRLVLARAAIDVVLDGELREPPIDPMTGAPLQYDAESGELSNGAGLTWKIRRP